MRNAHVPNGGQVGKGPIVSSCFKWKGETSHTEKRLLSAKATKTSFVKLIDLKLVQEKKSRVQARRSAAARVRPYVRRALLRGARSH